MAGKLQELGILTELDHTALAIYCQSVADYDEATRQLEKAGRILFNNDGNSIPNPWMEIQKMALRNVHEMMAEFYFEPDTRMRLDQGNNLAELLFKGKVLPSKKG